MDAIVVIVLIDQLECLKAAAFARPFFLEAEHLRSISETSTIKR